MTQRTPESVRPPMSGTKVINYNYTVQPYRCVSLEQTSLKFIIDAQEDVFKTLLSHGGEGVTRDSRGQGSGIGTE